MVSVIVPNYNHATYLKERIDSILGQTYQNLELILLDDCSVDNSREILDSYKNNIKVSHVVYNDINSGSPFAQWRKGVSLAQGEWVWIAESDDVADERFLDKLMGAVRGHANVGVAYSHLRWVDSIGKLMYSQDDSDSINHYTGEEFARTKLLYTTTIFNVSSAIFRKSVLESVDWSKIDNMKLCGDYGLYVQLAKKCDVCECELVLDNYRVHTSNTSSELTKSGWNFIEGMAILNDIVDEYKISQLTYGHYYANAWVKYNYSKKVNKEVFISFLKHKHIMVVLWFCMIKCKRLIKKIIKK